MRPPPALTLKTPALTEFSVSMPCWPFEVGEIVPALVENRLVNAMLVDRQITATRSTTTWRLTERPVPGGVLPVIRLDLTREAHPAPINGRDRILMRARIEAVAARFHAALSQLPLEVIRVLREKPCAPER